MRPIKTVLVPTDFSENSRQALDHAVLVAARTGAALHVLHVRALLQDDPYHPEHHFPDRDEIEQILKKYDQQSMESLEVTGELRVHREEVRASSVTPTVLSHADSIGADLIVMGTHGRTGISYALLGSVAERVVRGATVPVMTVPGREGGYDLEKGLRKIIVPVDFSDASHEAAAEAVGLAREFGAKIYIQHVMSEVPHPSFYYSGKSSIREVFPGLEQRARTKAEEMVVELGAGDLPHDVVISEGRIHRKIHDLAADVAADLVVIGSPIRSGLDRFVLGSIAEEVLRTAPCPVLAVRRKPEKDPDGTRG